MAKNILSDSELERLRNVAAETPIFANIDLVEDDLPRISRDLIELIVKKVTTDIGVNDDGELFVKDGEKIRLAGDAEIAGISKVSNFISDYLPAPKFNTVFSSINDTVIEREVVSAYTCSIIRGVFRDSEYVRNRYDTLLNNYSFDSLSSNDDNIEIKSFIQLLNELKNINSIAISVIISACNYKLSEVKKEPVEDFASLLTSAETTEFENLLAERKSIIKEANDALKTETVRSKRMKIIEKKDKDIELLCDRGLIGKYLKIKFLTTDCIPFTVKDKIYSLSLSFTKSLYNLQNSEVVSIEDADEYNLKIKAVRRRLLKMFLSGFKAQEVIAVRENIDHKVISKR